MFFMRVENDLYSSRDRYAHRFIAFLSLTERTYAKLVGRLFSHEGHFFLSRWGVFSLTENTEVTEVLSALIHSWKVFSLTERTEFTEHFCTRFRAHRRPPTYRGHRGLSAIIITNKGHNEAYILRIGVSR